MGPRSITQQHLREYVRENYLAERIVVAAAGPVDHQELVRSSEELFCHFRAGDGKRAEVRFAMISPCLSLLLEVFEMFRGAFGLRTRGEADVLWGGTALQISGGSVLEGSFVFCGQEGSLAHFAVGYEGVPWTHPDSLTFMVPGRLVWRQRQ